MRSFVIATVILSAIIFITICSSIYVTDRVEEMLRVCEELKRDSSAMLTDELVSRWQNCRDLISLSVHHSKIEQAEKAILSLECYLNAPEDFACQLALLTAALTEIYDSQQISLESIF